MFHFTNIYRLKLAPQHAEPLIICCPVNSNRMQSMYQIKHPTTWDLTCNKELGFKTADFPKTIRYQEDKNLRPESKEPQFVTDYLFQKNQSPRAESGRTITENLLTNT